MLKLSLDEGIVFDVLAITMVKYKLRPSENLNSIIKAMSTEIKNQIGQEKFENIIKSKEFQELIDVNLEVFKLVDEAQTSVGLAKRVQDGNFERYTKKTILQKKFFNDVITEEKW